MVEATKVTGGWLRDVIKANPDRFRLFGPDEVASNRLQNTFEVTDRVWTIGTSELDDHESPTGRVMEVLSEHLCEGWLESYLLTGRHGVFTSYEAFVHVIDSMVNQHAKWLKIDSHHPVAAAGGLAQLSAVEPRLAAGPQRLQPPGPRLHRPHGQQEGRSGPDLPAAGRQHSTVDDGPLPAQPALHQCGGGGQAARAELADHGAGGAALPAGPGHLGVRQQRRRRRAGRGDGGRRGRAHPRGAGRHRPAAANTCRTSRCGSSTWST